MAPEERDKLFSGNPKQRAEQERSEVIAKAKRLLEEGRMLREKAEELVKTADELMRSFKRNHPDA